MSLEGLPGVGVGVGGVDLGTIPSQQGNGSGVRMAVLIEHTRTDQCRVWPNERSRLSSQAIVRAAVRYGEQVGLQTISELFTDRVPTIIFGIPGDEIGRRGRHLRDFAHTRAGVGTAHWTLRRSNPT